MVAPSYDQVWSHAGLLVYAVGQSEYTIGTREYAVEKYGTSIDEGREETVKA